MERTGYWKNKSIPEDVRIKISKSLTGRKLSDDTRKKMSESKKGIPALHLKGKPWSDARRAAQKESSGIIKIYNREYPSNWIEIRNSIYSRDNWTCQECGIKCHGNGTKDKIQCHHIDYNTLNSELTNLITLCSSCHGKTNYQRDDWTSRYMSIVKAE